MSFSNVGSFSNAEADWAFDKTFGKAGISNEQCYYDPIGNHTGKSIDLRMDIAKALITKGPSIGNTTGGTFTEYGLMPSFLEPTIVDRTVRETPLVRLLPRRAVRGRSYVYNVVTAKAGAAFLGDDASLSVQVDSRAVATVQMKYLYAVGSVTGPALASGSGYINLLAEDIRVKTRSMYEALENEIVNGSTTTNANGFNGLRTLISTNSASNSGAALTLDNVRTDMATIFNANGICDLIVMDAATLNKVKGLLMDFQRNIERPSGQMDFGIPDAFMFDGALFIKDRYMPTTAGSREVLYLDTRYVFLAVLQDITYQEMGITHDATKFYLKWYGALVVTFEAAMATRTSLE